MEAMSFIYGMSFLAIICFILGFLLVIVEMFHPGFGAPGIAGGILLIIGIILTAQNLIQVLILVIIIFAVLAFALTLVLQSATKGRLSKILVLHEEQKKETGYIGTEDLNYFLGHEGVTLTILRPSGTADFDGIKLDVVSEGEFIDKDTKVKIIKVQGRRIVVREQDK
ncbi:MAG: NfeD family protein [Bacillota bacterium]|nr:NfeD family protein [Bacillota bacterium]